jgi:hypothetical protein
VANINAADFGGVSVVTFNQKNRMGVTGTALQKQCGFDISTDFTVTAPTGLPDGVVTDVSASFPMHNND